MGYVAVMSQRGFVRGCWESGYALFGKGCRAANLGYLSDKHVAIALSEILMFSHFLQWRKWGEPDIQIIVMKHQDIYLTYIYYH